MFAKYYYAEYNGDIYVYRLKPDDKQNEMTLFKNEEQVEQRFGFTGEFRLGNENARLWVKHTLLSSKHEFRIDNMLIELKKIRLGPLRKLLTSKGIYNEINPTKEVLEASKIRPTQFIVPVFFLLLGSYINHFVEDQTQFVKAASILSMIVAGVIFKGMLFGKYPSLKQMRKMGLFIIIATIMLGLFIGEVVFEFLFG